MKNLGEKLHEARVARGVTLRDAADMTKIRIDFLQNMEDGNFDFDLPEVYKRGFIRLYAQFLRLDPKAIHDEYVKLSAAQFRKSGAGPSKFPHFSKLVTELHTDSAAEEEPISTENRYDTADGSLPDGTDIPLDTKSVELDNKPPYFKIGAIVAAFVVVVILIVIILKDKTSPSGENTDLGPVQPVAEAPAAQQQKPAEQQQNSADTFDPYELTIAALGDTYAVIYYESEPDKPLFSGMLQGGERKSFTVNKLVRINLTDANLVKIDRDGKPLTGKDGKPLDLSSRKGQLILRLGALKK